MVNPLDVISLSWLDLISIQTRFCSHDLESFLASRPTLPGIVVGTLVFMVLCLLPLVYILYRGTLVDG